MISKATHKEFFNYLKSQKNFKSVICLNGELPDNNFFQELMIPIIALDGAANTLMEMKISPSLVIGDLDSVNPKYLSNLKSVKLISQDKSDFQKAMDYLKEKNLLPAIVTGIAGGYLDHILNNINLFIGSDNICYSPPLVCQNISGRVNLNLPQNTKISLIGIPQAKVTTSGLKWELKNKTLKFPGLNSTFNRTVTEEEIIIDTHSGSLLAFIYLTDIIDAAIT